MNAAIPSARNAKINNQITPIPTIIQIDITVISIIVRFHSVCSDPPILNRTAASEASRPLRAATGQIAAPEPLLRPSHHAATVLSHAGAN